MTDKKKEDGFETSFKRLEEILEQLNSGAVTLDNSLKLYEEANALIIHCSKRLTDAEQRVETLIKNRQGELQLDPNQQPATQPFPAGTAS